MQIVKSLEGGICQLKSQIIIFLMTYIIAKLIGRLNGISYNPFTDKFDLGLLIKDLMIWIISYAIVTLFIYRI